MGQKNHKDKIGNTHLSAVQEIFSDLISLAILSFCESKLLI